MADWNQPTLMTGYAAFLTGLAGRDTDAATMAASPTNPPTGYKRWNATTRRIEEWNGSAWAALPPVATIARSAGFSVDVDLDRDRWQRCTGSFTITLPLAATAGDGWRLPIINIGTGVITVARAGTDTVSGAAARVLASQNEAVELVSDGVSAWHAFSTAGAGGGLDAPTEARIAHAFNQRHLPLFNLGLV